jgi:pimeloyl-ACP methyl ester carboxylesterase
MEATINGAKIHYEREGAGLPVIFLHEGVADSRMWGPQVAAFAKHFDVIRPDIRGFGQSELPAAAWSGGDDILGLMDELGLKPAHLVGGSMGGALAIDFALDHPERVSRLVLLGTGINGANYGKNYPELFTDINAAEEAKDWDRLNRAEMRVWLDGPRRAEGYVSDVRLRELFLDMNGKTLQNDWDSAPTIDLDPPAVDRLHEITAPTLVIVGDEDVPTVFDATELLMQKVPNIRKAVIHDAAHMANLEHPEEFNKLVLDFLLES